MPLFRATVSVNLRPSVLDPAGEATKSAANRLGVKGIETLRIGKTVQIEVQAENIEDAKGKIEILSERLLANPVIEDWALELEQEQSLLK